jgi:hypothetical protein
MLEGCGMDGNVLVHPFGSTYIESNCIAFHNIHPAHHRICTATSSV